MGSQIVKQAVVVAQAAPKTNQQFEQIALFNEDGDALNLGTQMPVQAASVAADVATLKTDFNALLTKLKDAGLMASA